MIKNGGGPVKNIFAPGALKRRDGRVQTLPNILRVSSDSKNLSSWLYPLIMGGYNGEITLV